MLPVPQPDRNRTPVEDTRGTIHDLFRQQAALTPDAIALIYKDRQLSYRELDDRSDRLACHLQDLGVTAETLVGICIDRSESMVVCLLAVLKAGGAYVPLDSSYPQDRLTSIVEDADISFIAVSESTQSHIRLDPSRIIVIDVEALIVADRQIQTVQVLAGSENLAYVIYTSGSTGKPKGVMVEHRNVTNFFTGMDRVIGREPGVWLAVTSIAFDISVLELLWTLTRGFTVVIHDEHGVTTIADEIERHAVTHLQMTPSLARMFAWNPRVFKALGVLRQLLLGGEALPASLVQHIQQVFTGELYNMYGPTETTIWSTAYRIRESATTIPIGRPIANTQAWFLDEALTLVQMGEAGELFLGGDGVARGYRNKPDLTADRFLVLPALGSQRVYRTGDMARLLPDGNIEFLGRADYQIKLRGHRIEPGEIEAHLEQCAGVRQAVVVAREDREDDQRLVAYLVADSEVTATARDLRRALELKLPEAMIPSAFAFLPSLPLTQNGKIDRKALLNLPAPSAAKEASKLASDAANQMERIVEQALKEALGVAMVGLNDNFFDLGAHSLTVAEVHASLERTLNREISLVDLFEFSTVSSLSRHLAGLELQAEKSDRAQRRKLARKR
jgi:amino acid adenylation domain-containing protein